MPTLWPQQCPLSVYKTDEACDGIAASEEAPSDIVLGIPNLSLLSRMAIASFSIQEDKTPARALSDGPLCYQTKSSTSMLHQLASRPICHEHRCISGKMDGLPRTWIPSICSGGKVPPESEKGERLTLLVAPVWPSQAWYPLLLEYSVQSPILIPMYSNILHDPFSHCHPMVTQGQLQLLSELFEDGLQHRTINSIRSAVSMTHDQVEDAPIGQHLLVTRPLKGVYNLRPPQPRYSDTWNVDMVIRHLQSLGNYSKLTLKVLGQKLALLMALVEASRSSEIHALDVRYRVFKPEGMLFSLPTLTKKRTCGAPPKQLFFLLFPRTKISVWSNA